MSQTLGENTRPSFEVSPELGNWHCSCGPKEHGMGGYTVWAFVSLLVGMAVVLVPYLVEGKTPEDTKGAFFVFGAIGGFCIFIGFSILLLDLLAGEQVIHLYDGGLVREKGKKRIEFPWAEIESSHVAEWFEDRYAKMKHNVSIKGKKGTFYFTTHFQGNPEAILNMIKGRVEDLTFKRFVPE